MENTPFLFDDGRDFLYGEDNSCFIVRRHDSYHCSIIGNSAFQFFQIKGTRMAGQHGNSRVSLQNLEVVEVRPEENLLFVKGSIPGAKGGYVLVKKAVKK